VTTRAKILAGLLSVALVCGVIAWVQERRAHSTLESVRASLAVGDSQDKIERVLREHGLQPVVDPGGNSYRAHVWFHFRPDVSVIVVLNGNRQVGRVFIKDLVE
jgi:hypothetical protein